MKVSEIFTSIQGESTYTGIPCFFIRLAGCNLNCSYCDTIYAQNTDKAADMSVDYLIKEARKEGLKLVEITGGEPLLQKETPFLCKRLLQEGFKVLIETNGSINIKILPPDVIKIIDCKTPSSGEAQKMYFDNFSLLTPNDEIKFVIADFRDYQYALDIIEKYNLVHRADKILFSPVHGGPVSPPALAERILKDKLPVRLQIQLHKILRIK